MTATTNIANAAQSALLTDREACEMLRISRATLLSLRKRGEIRTTRIGTRGVRYQRRELERWIERATRKG